MNWIMWIALGYCIIGMAAAHNFLKWTKEERHVLDASARKNGLEDKVDPIINIMAVGIMLTWPWHAYEFILFFLKRKKNTP